MSTARFLALIVGALLLYAVIFQIAETLVGHGEPEENEADTRVEQPSEPIQPAVTRIGDKVEVRVGDHRTTVTISSDPDEAEAFAVCVREALNRQAPDGVRVPSGWVANVASSGRVRRMVDDAVQGCLDSGLTLPPRSD
jgi:hypothetical protein